MEMKYNNSNDKYNHRNNTKINTVFNTTCKI